MDSDLEILSVGPGYPWPPNDGYKTRLDQMVRALVSVGSVRHVAVVPSGAPPGPPASHPPDSVEVSFAPLDPDRPPKAWAREWVRSDLPRQVLIERFATLAADPPWCRADGGIAVPDVVYVSNLDLWIALRHVLPKVPTVVDFDNLQDELLRSRRRQPPPPAERRSKLPGVWGSWAASRALDLVDVRRWRTWQHRCSAEVDVVTVCSELDVARSGCANAIAVPNGYDLAWEPRPIDRTAVSSTPTVLFVGLLSYEPNHDAARWFATRVLPRLRRQVPALRFRVVGRGSDAVSDLRGLPGVDVVGEVRSMRGELEKADLVVVPIRQGAGTRLKVTEALANRIPCVSTRVGAEGIDVIDGIHLLLADDEDTFTSACGRLLGDASLRSRVAKAGFELYEARYRWPDIRARFAEVVAALAPR